MTASRDLALFVGVGMYEDPAFKPLRFCGNDIDDFSGILSDPNVAQFDARKLYNPSRDQILEALEQNSRRLQPEDKLIFYYAGHGKRAQTGKLYLIARDTKLDTIRTTGVPIDQVLEIMQDSRSSQRIMILDCCHSGAVGEEFRGEISDSFQDLARARGTCILAASTGIQLAEERESVTNDRGNGIFTRYLVEGLRTGLAAKDAEFITVDNLYDYAFAKVVTNSVQTPMKWIIDGVGNIIIGKSTSGGWQHQKQAIEEEFRNLHTERLVSGAYLDIVLQVTNRDWRQLNETERSFADQLLRFSQKQITLVDLIANREDMEAPAVHAVRPDEIKPPDKIIEPPPPKPTSFLDKNLISFDSLRSANYRLWSSPLGPTVFIVLVAAVIRLFDLNQSAALRLALTFASGCFGLAYAGYLLLKQVSQVRKDKGVSLRSIINIALLALPAILAILMIWAAIQDPNIEPILRMHPKTS